MNENFKYFTYINVLMNMYKLVYLFLIILFSESRIQDSLMIGNFPCPRIPVLRVPYPRLLRSTKFQYKTFRNGWKDELNAYVDLFLFFLTYVVFKYNKSDPLNKTHPDRTIIGPNLTCILHHIIIFLPLIASYLSF